ncbi:DUF2799 domain-containing protein [Simiduia curdlanivorans]|uniref:DUF2799 domain-containing protein n=1 Tax=Simiduia curdlanivorans TaxID=1492769 RepID=A0ABV8V729_9GAMM|nr:DUF2799 domain-containing protein [Simiduia curdlanivorans]MDN3640589.1 DUF2799 domain-containing protein [Simiduia curdlanivorans]
MKYFLYFSLVMLLASCATMNKEECEVADWRAVGYQHGAKGQSATAFENYQKDCSKHQIKADFSAFKQGHQQGIDEYCIYERGMELGRAGANYNNQCPSSRYERFEDGYFAGLIRYCTYDKGYELGARGAAVNANCPHEDFRDFSAGYADGYVRFEMAQEIRELEESLHGIDHQMQLELDLIADSEALIVSDKSSASQRTQALEDIKLHRAALTDLERQHRKVEKQLARLQAQFNDN